eukprot:TRINITY_DN55536_c0_g1_i1.p1 TRINITY_DN55536_c0_g1~~TRINITY_DN55536_c0_g1_i1.p1  ORF type:complete len:208 (+),score=96.62 TRINITY_DN55536_c0_g1_i1:214-837(+)
MELTKLASHYDNKPFLGPNSVVVDKHGTIFFTDSGHFGETTIDRPGGSVYAIVGKERILQPLAYQCLAHPSGITLSPHGKFLYVAETNRNRILRFIQKPRNVWHFSVFYQFSGKVGPTALSCDAGGNLFVGRFEFANVGNRGALSVVSPDGKLLLDIPTSAPEVTGLAFGTDDMPVLYITEKSTHSVFQLPLTELQSSASNVTVKFS